jgi:hypothetical protein
MTPSERLEAIAPADSAVRQLARLASIAVRVDASLLRRLRLELAPWAHVSAEIDLWFSDLFESRDGQYLVFDPELADTLRRELAAQHLTDGQFALDRAYAVLAEQHAQWAEAHRLEESLVYLSLSVETGRAAAADWDRLLQPVLAAMTASPERALEVSRWASRALPLLPASARQADAAAALEMAAALHLEMPLSMQAANGQRPFPAALRWLLPPADRASPVELVCDVRAEALVLRLPDADSAALPQIVVPPSRPLVVELRVFVGASTTPESVHTHGFTPGQALPLAADWQRAEIRNMAGQGWQISRERARPVQPPADERRRCFVVMGFGIKTDFKSSRRLDLDKTYRYIIKEAVEAAGLTCLRADEVLYEGTIDVPLYEQLLDADLVIADLSTSNLNAAYQLGVRHALRPASTIVIAESQFDSPFDVNHVVVRKYRHDGTSLDLEVVEEFRTRLTQSIRDIMARGEVDSPVYTFLSLDPPRRAEPAETAETGNTVDSAGLANGAPRQQSGPAGTCFVIMGFGEKTDYKTSRVLDLNKTYKHVIKKAAEAAGLVCLRADEIPNAGTIDVPMYEQLLEADLVIADLSTSNLNAAYELGIRHALKPSTTIVIAEERFDSPFDVNHIVVRKYRHDGKALALDEVDRFRDELARAIRDLMTNGRVDSPIYTFLPLTAPRRMTADMRVKAAKTAERSPSLDALLDSVRESMAERDFVTARSLLTAARKIAPNDSVVVQQLALVTYKSRLPDEAQALEQARSLLMELNPMHSNDAQTLSLWGAVHKRRFVLNRKRSDLDAAIFAYEKSYRLLADYYNGINWAFLLNLRASISEPADAMADFVLARRTRADVAEICKSRLDGLKDSPATKEERFWLIAAQTEAALGDGRPDAEARSAALLSTLPGDVDTDERDWLLQRLQGLRELLKAQESAGLGLDGALSS